MKTKVLWTTNLAAPYRIPLWRHVGQRVDLTVLLLEMNKRLSVDHGSNRGIDWLAATADGFRMAEARTVRVARGEARYYGHVDPRVMGLVARTDCLILGGWESPAYWQLLAQAKVQRKPCIGFYESTLASQSRRSGPIASARGWFFRHLDAVVVPGPAAQAAIADMGVRSDRIHVGFNAVDTEAFAGAPFTPSTAGHRYIYVGQLIQRKRVDRLLSAFATIHEEGDTLTIVGRGEDGEKLHRLAESLGVADQVSWIDFIENSRLPSVMGRHDTLVLCSDEEVWGLVVNEALASGLQTIATENCGVVPSVAGMAGVFVASADGTDLAVRMRDAREQFAGRIESPEILKHTPEEFGDTFLAAVHSVVRH